MNSASTETVSHNTYLALAGGIESKSTPVSPMSPHTQKPPGLASTSFLSKSKSTTALLDTNDDASKYYASSTAIPPKARKVAELLYEFDHRYDSLQLGGLSPLSGQSAVVIDEWENDDDAGYVVIPLTEDEFFEMEEVIFSNTQALLLILLIVSITRYLFK